MNNLTIDDIHKIRREHAVSTQNMNFDEYKADLHEEIKPLLNLLKSMKNEQVYFTKIKSIAVAEPQATYQTKNIKT